MSQDSIVHRKGETLGFTIVVCTRNRRSELLRLLESLRGIAASRSAAWSVLVVDNASSDGTPEMVASLASGYPLPLGCVVEPQLGIASARSRGLAECGSGVVAYLDDDVTLSAGWMLAMEDAFGDDSVAGVGGRIIPIFPPNAPADYVRAVTVERCGSTGLYDLGEEVRELGPDRSGGYPHGANMAFRRDAGHAIGGFRAAFGWGRADIPGEETDFFARLARAGGRIVYVPKACVQHHLQANKVGWDYLRKWHQGYGHASVLMRPKPPAWLRWIKIVEQSSVWLRYSIVLLFIRGGSRLRPCRKVWQAEGRIAELLAR